MKIIDAKFLLSAPHYKKCPKPDLPEYAFIGRSNVGKSSLINALTGRKKLAKTSVTPGKTQLINHFIIDNKWYMVDLPGYGYAKSSKAHRAKWSELSADYIRKRPNLLTVFILIDARHDPMQSDIEFINWLGSEEISFAIAFTKIDKLPKNKVNSHINKYRKHLLKFWKELPPIFVTSSVKSLGLDEILDYVGETNNLFKIDN
ncbi:MAG: YihA family ribosome biogenesis GTP-binding protein [Bacteroidetes bacterium]|nr:MAG: YihA family ribosome biogenesis GTP-binding protein [Bacteroidota bacterium]